MLLRADTVSLLVPSSLPDAGHSPLVPGLGLDATGGIRTTPVASMRPSCRDRSTRPDRSWLVLPTRLVEPAGPSDVESTSASPELVAPPVSVASLDAPPTGAPWKIRIPAGPTSSPVNPRARSPSPEDRGGNASRSASPGDASGDTRSGVSFNWPRRRPTAGPDPAAFPLPPDRASVLGL